MKTSTCRICHKACKWVPKRFAWVHVTSGADHAPDPAP